MTARKNSYVALRRRMQAVARLLEAWASSDHSYLPPIQADKIASRQRGYAQAAQQIRDNL